MFVIVRYISVFSTLENKPDFKNVHFKIKYMLFIMGGLGYRIKAGSPLVGHGSVGGVPSMEVLPRDPIPYLR